MEQGHLPESIERETWASKFGLLLSSVMACVGTGNIWRFPYLCAKYGGAPFLVWYIVSAVLISIVVLHCESSLGQSTRRSTIGAFAQVGRSRYWRFSGAWVWWILTIVMVYYNVVCAWVLRYVVTSVTGALWSTDSSSFFNQWVNTSSVAVYLVIVNIVIFGTLYFGVQKGIERSNKVMAPFLFLCLLATVIRSVTLKGAGAGINFYLASNWGLFWRPETIAQAMGQALWSTAAGTGTWIVFGSYTRKTDDIAATYVSTPLSDTGAAFLAGFAVLPAVVAFGVPLDSGSSLAFIALPKVFAKMPLGNLVAPCFFGALLFAGLSSAIGSEEPTVAGMIDEWGWDRKKAVLASFLIYTIGGLAYAFSKNAMDWMDLTVGTFGLMISCFMVLILVGYVWGADEVRQKVLNPNGLIKLGPYWNYLVRYASPAFLLFGMISFYRMWVVAGTPLPVQIGIALPCLVLIGYTFYRGLLRR